MGLKNNNINKINLTTFPVLYYIGGFLFSN